VSLLGGGNKSSLPSLSWDSVVSSSSGDETDADTQASGVGGEAAESGAPSAPIGNGISGVLGSLGLETSSDTQQHPVTLDLPSGATESAVVTPTPFEPRPQPQPAGPPPAEPTGQQQPSQPTHQAFAGEARPVQPSPQQPVAQQPVPVAPVEQAVVSQPVQPVQAEQLVAQQSVQAAPAAQPVVAAAPAVPPPTMPTPAVSTVAPAASPAPSTAPSYRNMMPEASRSRRRQRSGGSGLGLLLTLLVLAGLVAAGFVYGRPYLFPDDFDQQTKPYAEAIESVRGTPIADPFLVIDEAASPYASGYDAQAVGDDWHDDVPMWRAFGLADADFEPSSAVDVTPSRPSAYYSFADGQVHTDLPLVDGVPDSAVARAAVLAVLDQDYQWSLAVDGRSDERAAVQHSLVIAEADRIRTAGGFPAPVAADFTSAELAVLPPLVAHRLAAPELYARVVGQPTAGDEARLAELESFGIQLPALTPLGAGPVPVLGEGQTLVGAAEALDRNFWFLVFDAHLPASTAADLSRSLTGASVTPFATVGGQTCWSATLVAPSGEGAPLLANGLSEWVAAARAASAATMSVVTELVVDLRVCDPGRAAAPAAPVADQGVDAGTIEGQDPATDPVTELDIEPSASSGTADSVRALQAYRATELAVVAGVADAGGDSVAISQALAELEASSIGDDLALASVAMTDAQLASAAVERTAAIVQAAVATIAGPAPAAPAVVGDQAPVVTEEPAIDGAGTAVEPVDG